MRRQKKRTAKVSLKSEPSLTLVRKRRVTRKKSQIMTYSWIGLLKKNLREGKRSMPRKSCERIM